MVVSCVVHKQDSLPQIYKIEAATNADKLFPTSNPTIKGRLYAAASLEDAQRVGLRRIGDVSEQGSFGGCLRVRIATSG